MERGGVLVTQKAGVALMTGRGMSYTSIQLVFTFQAVNVGYYCIAALLCSHSCAFGLSKMNAKASNYFVYY